MTTDNTLSADTGLDELTFAECQRRLGLHAVGRIAFAVEGLPIVLPVNYRFVSDDLGLWVVLRTRAGNIIDRAPDQVAFEIDGIDHHLRQGWSVLVRGVLHHLEPFEVEVLRNRIDPKPWPQQERPSWLAIKPRTITGRQLRAGELEWAFPSEAYL